MGSSVPAIWCSPLPSSRKGDVVVVVEEPNHGSSRMATLQYSSRKERYREMNSKENPFPGRLLSMQTIQILRTDDTNAKACLVTACNEGDCTTLYGVDDDYKLSVVGVANVGDIGDVTQTILVDGPMFIVCKPGSMEFYFPSVGSDTLASKCLRNVPLGCRVQYTGVTAIDPKATLYTLIMEHTESDGSFRLYTLRFVVRGGRIFFEEMGSSRAQLCSTINVTCNELAVSGQRWLCSAIVGGYSRTMHPSPEARPENLDSRLKDAVAVCSDALMFIMMENAVCAQLRLPDDFRPVTMRTLSSLSPSVADVIVIDGVDPQSEDPDQSACSQSGRCGQYTVRVFISVPQKRIVRVLRLSELLAHKESTSSDGSGASSALPAPSKKRKVHKKASKALAKLRGPGKYWAMATAVVERQSPYVLSLPLVWKEDSPTKLDHKQFELSNGLSAHCGAERVCHLRRGMSVPHSIGDTKTSQVAVAPHVRTRIANKLKQLQNVVRETQRNDVLKVVLLERYADIIGRSETDSFTVRNDHSMLCRPSVGVHVDQEMPVSQPPDTSSTSCPVQFGRLTVNDSVYPSAKSVFETNRPRWKASILAVDGVRMLVAVDWVHRERVAETPQPVGSFYVASREDVYVSTVKSTPTRDFLLLVTPTPLPYGTEVPLLKLYALSPRAWNLFQLSNPGLDDYRRMVRHVLSLSTTKVPSYLIESVGHVEADRAACEPIDEEEIFALWKTVGAVGRISYLLHPRWLSCTGETESAPCQSGSDLAALFRSRSVVPLSVDGGDDSSSTGTSALEKTQSRLHNRSLRLDITITDQPSGSLRVDVCTYLYSSLGAFHCTLQAFRRMYDVLLSHTWMLEDGQRDAAETERAAQLQRLWSQQRQEAETGLAALRAQVAEDFGVAADSSCGSSSSSSAPPQQSAAGSANVSAEERIHLLHQCANIIASSASRRIGVRSTSVLQARRDSSS